MEPSPLTDKIDMWFGKLLDGLRAFPFDIPGTASHTARKMKDEQGKKLSDEEVVHNIVSLVIAGYESTTIAIMWAVYHLAKSPVVLAKLREENVAMSKSKGGSTLTGLMITHDDIPKMKYTAKVVEETIRMANIAPMVHRVANKDVEYRGYTIPKGWAVLVWLRSVHTDPNYYLDPLSFNPDRWDEAAKPGTYQVFGGGPRICAGNMLARLQMGVDQSRCTDQLPSAPKASGWRSHDLSKFVLISKFSNGMEVSSTILIATYQIIAVLKYNSRIYERSNVVFQCDPGNQAGKTYFGRTWLRLIQATKLILIRCKRELRRGITP
uniref:Cytochrome P450 88A1 n=1 Tax=Aegilops tauschii TaxID=37682 RepID=M8BBC1_AEGTA